MQKATPCHDDVFMMHAQKVWYRSQLVQYIIENNIWKFTQRISMETPCCFPRQSTNKTKQNKTIKLQGILSLLIWTTLKTDSFHDANFVVTGGTRVVVRQSQVPPVTAKLASWQLSCFREVTGEKTQIEVGGATVAREKTQTEFDGATVAREKTQMEVGGATVSLQTRCSLYVIYRETCGDMLEARGFQLLARPFCRDNLVAIFKNTKTKQKVKDCKDWKTVPGIFNTSKTSPTSPVRCEVLCVYCKHPIYTYNSITNRII